MKYYRSRGVSPGVVPFICIFVVLFCVAMFVMCLDMGEKDSSLNENSIQETIEHEKEGEPHTHEWNETEIEGAEIVQTVELQAIASEGVEKVYLTRYRSDPNNPMTDVYMAYDEFFNDINISMLVSNTTIEIEYITDGVPRMEKYKHSKPFCNICGARLMNYEKYTYKFYIPEGTLLVRWDKTGD